MVFFDFSLGLVIRRFAELLGGPFVNPNMLWIALPLIITFIAVELYFKKYKEEKIGWNSALTNALVLVFVALNLFQHIFTKYEVGFFRSLLTTGFFITLIILILGILLFFTDFFHRIPEKIAFIVSAHLPINITAYTAIVIVYNQLPVDLPMVVAWLLLILLLKLIFFIVRKIEPDSMK